MKTHQIAIQLYTLRDFLKTPPEISETLKRVRRIGYEAIQVSGMGPIAESELVAICRGEGLTICGTHEPGATILNEPEVVVERLKRLGCVYTAYPYPAGIVFDDPESVAELIRKLDASGAKLRGEGLALSYHNHANEFYRAGGRTVLRQIYDGTDPLHLKAELDTYWVQYGGGNPVKWIEAMAGRLPWLHCKDYAATPDNRAVFAEVGSGNLDWQAIIAAAESGGCEWFIVEQDTCPGAPFESIAKSYEFLRTNFCHAKP